MKRLLVYTVVTALSVGWLAGCSEETKTTKKETIKTPEGSTTTTDTHKVDKTGNEKSK